MIWMLAIILAFVLPVLVLRAWVLVKTHDPVMTYEESVTRYSGNWSVTRYIQVLCALAIIFGFGVSTARGASAPVADVLLCIEGFISVVFCLAVVGFAFRKV